MIVNAPGVLGILLAVVESVAGGVLLVVAWRGLRAAGATSDRSIAWEPLRHLVLLLALLLAILSAVSLFVWLLLLQSYVPQWEDVRCIVGVLRIGTGSEGATGWLPTLADATSLLRAALLFAAGAGVVLHVVGRDRPEGPLRRRHLAALLVVGFLAVGGAATQTAYIVIPKTERFRQTGCCTTTAWIAAEKAQAPHAPSEARRDAAFYAIPALVLGAGAAAKLRSGWRTPAAADIVRVTGSTLVLVAGLHFVADVVAPARLGLPLHRCTYCLAAEAPETLAGLALLALPMLAAVWCAAARWLGPGEGPTFAKLETALGRLSILGLFGAVAFFMGEWVVS
ncbi:MAG: hypothetical protein ACYTE5_11870 [Planctomycetota bacterium]